MFLRNYDNAMLIMHLFSERIINYNSDDLKSTGNEFVDGYCNQKTPNGSIKGFYLGSASNYTAYYFSLATLAPSAICLGTGNIPVTYDDYRLSGDVVPNNLVRAADTKVYNPETNKWVRTLVATYANTSSEVIIIGEWGMFRQNDPSIAGQPFSHTADTVALTYREVFDEPIVIEPGKSATITFTMEIPMPNHP